ncbi:MAG: ComEC/Rec2 family competence protein, partial [Lachnospiraceae bacterium]|nr:ComEC/Rec2 family competence protein [Lachnospiraceae bacterium]
MKRPLCLLAILVTAAVFLYLELSETDITGVNVHSDGDVISIVGYVQNKEYKKSFASDKTPVLYILPTDQDSLKKSLIQCYMSVDGGVLPSIGEYVEIEGRVKNFSSPTNPGEFDSRLYYSSLKISYRVTGARLLRSGGGRNLYREGLCRVRLILEDVLDDILPGQDSAIMKAMLLGDKSHLDDEIRDMYKNSGIIHIIAISGLHISIIGMGLFELLRKARLRILPAAVLSILVIYSYGVMCGMSSSSYRAIIMFAIRLLAPVAGRTYDMLSALALSGILLMIDEPLLLYNSGFLFSFGAIIGIAFVMPHLKAKSEDNSSKKMRFADDGKSIWESGIILAVISSLKVSVSIFLVTLPVYMTYYYTYPLISVLLNMVVLPLMPLLLVMGLICLFLGLISQFAAGILGTVIHMILELYRYLCLGSGNLPGKTWYIGHADRWKIICYVILIFVFVMTYEKIRDRYRYILVAFAVIFIIYSPIPDLMITAVDVGQGDGIVIRTKRECLLIDGGSTSKKKVGEYSIIPYLKYEKISSLDAAIITHEDEDHISGVLEIMDDMEKGGLRIKTLILPDIGKASMGENYLKLKERANQLDIPVKYISCGQEIGFDDMQMICLNPVKG